jgi:NTP pyrophosphatase (non-canonical NTP hydrolase)
MRWLRRDQLALLVRSIGMMRTTNTLLQTVVAIRYSSLAIRHMDKEVSDILFPRISCSILLWANTHFKRNEYVRNNDMNELILAVEEWAAAKGILSAASPMAQMVKTHEEVNELMKAVLTNDSDEIIDGLGDVMVTLIIQAKMQGLDLNECLGSAYNVISKRTGKMVNGTFVKDAE